MGSHNCRLPGVHWQSTVILTLCAACRGQGKQPALSSQHHRMLLCVTTVSHTCLLRANSSLCSSQLMTSPACMATASSL